MVDVAGSSNEIDICERLRRGFGGLAPPVCDEAANEIERLRLELAENKRINMDHKLSLDIIARAAHEPPLEQRPFSASQRLHNICDALSEQADESPFTREEWERVDKEIVELQSRNRELIEALKQREDQLRAAFEREHEPLPRYQCFVAGCPGDHVSKMGVCPSPPPPVEYFNYDRAKALADAIVQKLCDSPNHTSPDDDPQLLLCYASELENHVISALEIEFERRTGRSCCERPTATKGCDHANVRATSDQRHYCADCGADVD